MFSCVSRWSGWFAFVNVISVSNACERRRCLRELRGIEAPPAEEGMKFTLEKSKAKPNPARVGMDLTFIWKGRWQ